MANGFVAIVMGFFGSGKTTMIKRDFLSKVQDKNRILCYALVKKDLGDYTYIMNKYKFIDIAYKRVNTLFIIDEAKTFFPKDDPDPDDLHHDSHNLKMIKWFINARKFNNVILIVYHGLRELPLWLLMYSFWFFRFNTNDQINYQLTRFGSYPTIVESLTKYPKIDLYDYDEIKIR